MSADAAQRRIVVIEANEVPRRVLEHHAASQPDSSIARLLERGDLIETEVTEKLHRTLYPSQTWYSMNSGVPYEQHRVFWYGDPKPEALPLYWQVAAWAGRSVGLVNTLHSSPLRQQCAGGEFHFVIPDCFADESDTTPGRYERFQRFNLELTSSSGRNARLRPGMGHVPIALSLPALGVRPATLLRLASMAAGIASKRVNKERLRTAQAMLLADMFLKLSRRHDPDLAIFFTNHVASAMHRYWYAAFPDDWERPHYSDQWVQRYQDEIPAAVRSLDRIVGNVWRWCEATDRTLVLVSSMGQCGEPDLDTSISGTAIVRSPERFGRALGFERPFTVGSAMVPQIHYRFGSDADAAAQAEVIERGDMGSSSVGVQRNGEVLTVTYRLDGHADGSLRLNGASHSFADCGVVWEPVDNHRSGTHHPMGVMLIADPRGRQSALPTRIDALEVAPLLLNALGVEVPDTMREPVGAL